jgi:histidyl-tRNA synthetase
MSNLSTQPYKGARDFYPEDKRIQNYMFDVWRSVVESYGYEEYDAPIIEPTALYLAKSGEELVNEQTYSFLDRGGRDVTIRPEMTPTVSRMIAGRRQETAYPARWYSIPNLWRYERPQQGRLREHWQLNVDMFGVATLDAELEMLQIIADTMSAFGATQDDYKIHVNSRKLTIILLAEYLKLDAGQFHKIVKLLDKRAKISEELFYSEARQTIDDEDVLGKLKSILDAKSFADLPSEIQTSEPIESIRMIFTHLKDNNITNVKFDVSLMRGFDYYTDIVFEVFDTDPSNPRSLTGGGRYDGLVELFGAQPLPVVGFGWGDVTLENFLRGHNLLPVLDSKTNLHIIPIGSVLRECQGIAKLLRQEGINVAVDISGKKTDKQIKSALSKSVKYVLFVGNDELNKERFNLKDLQDGKEQELSLPEIIAHFKQ